MEALKCRCVCVMPRKNNMHCSDVLGPWVKDPGVPGPYLLLYPFASKKTGGWKEKGPFPQPLTRWASHNHGRWGQQSTALPLELCEVMLQNHWMILIFWQAFKHLHASQRHSSSAFQPQFSVGGHSHSLHQKIFRDNCIDHLYRSSQWKVSRHLGDSTRPLGSLQDWTGFCEARSVIPSNVAYRLKVGVRSIMQPCQVDALSSQYLICKNGHCSSTIFIKH